MRGRLEETKGQCADKEEELRKLEAQWKPELKSRMRGDTVKPLRSKA